MTALTLDLAMWSGPRNISTAMMRAWENRADTVVEDEPLYGPYLATTGVDHPLAAEVIAAQGADWRWVVERLGRPIAGDVSIRFQKHMTHHLTPDVDRGWIAGLTNAFLIRDPFDVVASYADRRDEVTADDLGFRIQAELYDWLCKQDVRDPVVIDAADVSADPEAALRALCANLGVEFSDRMLTWPAGRRASDGVWASHWYAAVEASTGWVIKTADRPRRPLVNHLHAVAETCWPYYEHLAPHRLRV